MVSRKITAIAAALVMAAGLLAGCSDSVRSIDEREKDYDLYIFNTGGESSQALKAAVEAYSDEVGMKIKLWSPETGDDAEGFLKSEMESDGQPGLYWVRDDAALEQWVAAGKAMDLRSGGKEIAALVEKVPEDYRLTAVEPQSGEEAQDGAEAEESSAVYGFPAGLEGFGLIADREMLAAIFGEENVGAFIEAYRTATYDEWTAMVKALSAFARKGTSGTITLSGTEFALAEKKEGAAASLKAAFAVPGTETWVYAEYLQAPAVAAIFKDVEAVRAATPDQLEAGRMNAEGYAETLYWLCANSVPTRGDNLVNPEKASYGAQITNMATGSCVFMLQSSRSFARLKAENGDMSERLVILPAPMRLSDETILSGRTAAEMNSSIPVWAPGYFVINSQVSERERRVAEGFLVWLNSSDIGRKYLAEDIALMPATASSAKEAVTSLGGSVYSYMENGRTLPYLMNGCPALWAENDMGTYLIENYLSKKSWRDDTYQDIANFFVSSWSAYK